MQGTTPLNSPCILRVPFFLTLKVYIILYYYAFQNFYCCKFKIARLDCVCVQYFGGKWERERETCCFLVPSFLFASALKFWGTITIFFRKQHVHFFFFITPSMSSRQNRGTVYIISFYLYRQNFRACCFLFLYTIEVFVEIFFVIHIVYYE